MISLYDITLGDNKMKIIEMIKEIVWNTKM